MNAFEFKSAINISKFTKNNTGEGMYDYSLTINSETYYFVNWSFAGSPKEVSWSLITPCGSEAYCYASSRKQVLADLLTSLYLDYKLNGNFPG